MDEMTANPRVYDLESLLRQVRIWRLKDDRIVFTNGCFDILHQGHVDLLRRAYNMGDRTIVAVNTDASVRGLDKAPDRPVNNEQARAEVLSALRYVDAVVLFDEPTPLKLIEAIKPEVLVKGGDWAVEQIVGADVVQAAGGEVYSLELVDGISTTGIIERINGQG